MRCGRSGAAGATGQMGAILPEVAPQLALLRITRRQLPLDYALSRDYVLSGQR